MKKTIFALAAAICFPSASYAAETYCSSPAIVMYDGLDTTIEWVITSVNARKTQKIGQVKPTRGCSRDFRPGRGMILSREVITAAKLGKFRLVNQYRIYYESEKLGTDEVAYKTTWESGGRISSAVVRIKVRVIGTAI
jgi:hypothetical protein